MKTNQSLFSPARLVYMAGPDVPQGAEAQKPNVNNKEARKALLQNAKQEIDKMEDSDQKAELNKMWLDANIAETYSEFKAQDESLALFDRLASASGDKALEAGANKARREIDQARRAVYKSAYNKVINNLLDAKNYDNPKRFSANGKTYETVLRRTGVAFTRPVES